MAEDSTVNWISKNCAVGRPDHRARDILCVELDPAAPRDGKLGVADWIQLPQPLYPTEHLHLPALDETHRNCFHLQLGRQLAQVFVVRRLIARGVTADRDRAKHGKWLVPGDLRDGNQHRNRPVEITPHPLARVE
ncbi:hypothetical protein ACFOHS_19355 [Jhaorihella thermophila]